MMQESLRLRVVQSPIIPVVGELIRNHPGVISLGQGVVSYPPPRQAFDQIAEFLANPDLHKYQAVYGVPQLLELIEAKLRDEHGIDVKSANQRRRVVVTAGGNMAFVNALLAVADAGDEIILQTPYYFNHEMAITMANCRATFVPTDENYQLRPDLIAEAITDKTRAVVTISPNNPTGAVYSEAALREVNEICRARGKSRLLRAGPIRCKRRPSGCSARSSQRRASCLRSPRRSNRVEADNFRQSERARRGNWPS